MVKLVSSRKIPYQSRVNLAAKLFSRQTELRSYVRQRTHVCQQLKKNVGGIVKLYHFFNQIKFSCDSDDQYNLF